MPILLFMWLRRVFYYAQYWVIPVLPLWLLVARGLSVNGGWEFVVLLFAAPLLSLALIVVMGLTVARKAVRRARMLSWVDVGILSTWYASVLAAGIISHPLMAVLALSLTLVAFWSAVWQWIVETRQRVTLAFASYDAIPVTFQ
ncbi:MAG: MFS transporter [Microbacteriaceae bacterium]|nr:MFS transporter [Microbacteriaceae bacterium]